MHKLINSRSLAQARYLDTSCGLVRPGAKRRHLIDRAGFAGKYGGSKSPSGRTRRHAEYYTITGHTKTDRADDPQILCPWRCHHRHSLSIRQSHGQDHRVLALPRQTAVIGPAQTDTPKALVVV